jgi:hypothetical protein
MEMGLIFGKPFKTEMANDYHDYYFRGLFRDWMRTGDWHGPAALHPLGATVMRGFSDSPRVTMPPIAIGYGKITKRRDSTPMQAGIYMPDINLHRGFESALRFERERLGRELVRSERKPLWVAYVKACNKYQLVCLPDQTALPFNACAGSIWDATDGCLSRLSLLAEKTIGRPLTRKEGIFIQAQWPALTATKRASQSRLKETRNSKDNAAAIRTLGELWKKGTEATKAYILANAEGTLASNSRGALTFDYRGTVAKLRRRLKDGLISHADYNAAYGEAKALRAKQLDILETIATTSNPRNQQKNSGAVRVVHNASGLSPEKSPTQSKLYAPDGLSVSDDCSEYTKKRRGEDLRTPTVWKDGTRRN